MTAITGVANIFFRWIMIISSAILHCTLAATKARFLAGWLRSCGLSRVIHRFAMPRHCPIVRKRLTGRNKRIQARHCFLPKFGRYFPKRPSGLRPVERAGDGVSNFLSNSTTDIDAYLLASPPTLAEPIRLFQAEPAVSANSILRYNKGGTEMDRTPQIGRA